MARPVAGQPIHRDRHGAAAADPDDRCDPALPPGPRPRRPHRLAAFVLEDDPPAQGRRHSLTRARPGSSTPRPRRHRARSRAARPAGTTSRAACPRDANPAEPSASHACRHRRTDRSLTRSSPAITAAGARCSNLFTAPTRTRSRRLRPPAVNPPPCAYRIHPAYRRKLHPSAQRTSRIKDL